MDCVATEYLVYLVQVSAKSTHNLEWTLSYVNGSIWKVLLTLFVQRDAENNSHEQRNRGLVRNLNICSARRTHTKDSACLNTMIHRGYQPDEIHSRKYYICPKCSTSISSGGSSNPFSQKCRFDCWQRHMETNEGHHPNMTDRSPLKTDTPDWRWLHQKGIQCWKTWSRNAKPQPKCQHQWDEYTGTVLTDSPVIVLKRQATTLIRVKECNPRPLLKILNDAPWNAYMARKNLEYKDWLICQNKRSLNGENKLSFHVFPEQQKALV